MIIILNFGPQHIRIVIVIVGVTFSRRQPEQTAFLTVHVVMDAANFNQC